MRKRHPGWIMRIYTNYERRELNALFGHKDVYMCDVRRLPYFGYTLHKIYSNLKNCT